MTRTARPARDTGPAVIKSRRIHILLLPLICTLFLCSCVNFLPFPRRNEKTEAMALASRLKRYVPNSQTLDAAERACANELKITIGESHGQLDLSNFADKFRSYIDRLAAIRDQRRQIQLAVRQSVWNSPLVFVVQHNAVISLQDEIDRDDRWIQYVQNVRLRIAMGRREEFPELALLTHDLDTFLGQTPENPLSNQMRALEEEFRFGETELGR